MHSGVRLRVLPRLSLQRFYAASFMFVHDIVMFILSDTALKVVVFPSSSCRRLFRSGAVLACAGASRGSLR